MEYRFVQALGIFRYLDFNQNRILNIETLMPRIKPYELGGGGVQGQGKGQRLMSNIAVNDYIWLATCQGRIYEK